MLWFGPTLWFFDSSKCGVLLLLFLNIEVDALNYRSHSCSKTFWESRAFIHNRKPDSLTTYIQARVMPLEECISGARSIGLTVDRHCASIDIRSQSWVSSAVQPSSRQPHLVSQDHFKTTSLCQAPLQHQEPLSPWVVTLIQVCLLPLELLDPACPEGHLPLSPLLGPTSSAASGRTPMLPSLKPSDDSLVLPQEPGSLPLPLSLFKCLVLCLVPQLLPVWLFPKVLSSMEFLLPSGLLLLCNSTNS